MAESLTKKFFSVFQYAALMVAAISSCLGFEMHAAKPSLRKVVGVVTDSENGERLSFVNVYSKKNKKGTTTDLNGVFTLYLPVGANVEVSSLGYTPESQTVTASRDTMRFMM
ncbi:MAG: carboxypeptidase-like regulatory domain-containing protein [Muribaculaceae bacterium]|nr:carboxypeptidase-like regulatory domain-containing protein [Muribaculaceae bacterium]